MFFRPLHLFRVVRRVNALAIRHQSFARPLKVLFYGSDHFSLATLRVLAKEWKCNNTSGLQELSVVTGIKRPPNPVHVFSQKNGIPFRSWPAGNDDSPDKFDIGVVVSFSHLIPARIINSFPLGMINLHSSLLPRWRGAAPIIYSIKSGDPETGVTIMKVAPRQYDIGNILCVEKVPVDDQMLLPELHDKLSHVGAQLMLDTLRNVHERLDNSRPQPNDGVTYAPKVEGNALSFIDWNTMTAREVFNLFRALYGFRPILTGFDNVLVKLLDIRIHECSSVEGLSSGGSFSFDRSNNRLIVKCADRSISVGQLQVVGKPKMNAVQFMNGFVKKRPENVLLFSQPELNK